MHVGVLEAGWAGGGKGRGWGGGGGGWERGFCYTIRNLKMHSNSAVSWVGLLLSPVIEHGTEPGRCACIQVCWRRGGRGVERGGGERRDGKGGSDTAYKT